MIRRALYSLLPSFSIVLALTAAGCSTDSSQGTVSGTVTLDGAPVATGLIRFVPADGQTATADATISDGAFTAGVPVGEKRITISSPKVVGTRKMYETPDSPTVDVIQELLPERYNVRSELTFTVEAGNQQKEFVLSSGK